MLYTKLMQLILQWTTVMTINGRIILLADHIKVSKEGLRMPGIQKWHQESGDSSKGEYIEGHNFGVVSILSSGLRSIPVMAGMHESKTQNGGESIVEQMGRMMGKVAQNAQKPAIGVCDAYFFSKNMLAAVNRFRDEEGKPMLHMVTRAKKNAAGYTEVTRKEGHRGRPAQYGSKIILSTCFKGRAGDFVTTKLKLYGKEETVGYLVVDLRWKPVKQIVRFVLTDIKGKQFILMSSDLTLSGEQIIQLYSYRFKIEVLFDDFKNDFGGFKYHFWTKSLSKRKHGQNTIVPEDQEKQKQIAKAKNAIEVFVCVHIIALGIVSLLSINHSRIIWDHYTGWLRTIRTQEPTIMVTKQVLSQEYFENSSKLRRFPCFNAIFQVRRPDMFIYKLEQRA
jgi:hypothetical protein